jgi:ABC-2 type transport system permease protein
MKFAGQWSRLLAALVRPALWLLVFGAGLHDLLGVSIIEPYQTYITYQEYILPGLIGIIVLFQSMQSALSLVHDRDAGVMQAMFVSPLPLAFLLLARVVGATVLAVVQVYAFLALAAAFGILLPLPGLIALIPTIALVGFMLGSVGLLISMTTRHIENFAGMMNFVVFPMFFISSALYPLWKLREAGAWPLYWLAQINPFTHAVELIRFSAYGALNPLASVLVASVGALAFGVAAWVYDPYHAIRFQMLRRS